MNEPESKKNSYWLISYCVCCNSKDKKEHKAKGVTVLKHDSPSLDLSVARKIIFDMVMKQIGNLDEKSLQLHVQCFKEIDEQGFNDFGSLESLDMSDFFDIDVDECGSFSAEVTIKL